MDAYRLFIHRNFGGTSFTKKLIKEITAALKAKGFIGNALSKDCYVEWHGEQGEELIFDTLGFCKQDWHKFIADMLEISNQFTECQFCLRHVDFELYVMDAYFFKGQWEDCPCRETWPRGDMW